MPDKSAVALALSAAQREIWYAEQQMGPDNRVYKLGEYVEIHGPVDPTAFEAALRQVVAEAESLHVRFVEGDEGPCQVFEPVTDWPLTVLDLRGQPDPTSWPEPGWRKTWPAPWT